MSVDGIRAQVEAFAAAVAAGDAAGLRAFLADDYFGHARRPDEPSQADRWVKLVADVVAALPDLHVEAADIEPEGDVVHVRASVGGTHTGELWGSPATGSTVRLEVPFTLRDSGRGWTMNGDVAPTAMLGALRELGVVPPADEMHLPPRNPIRPPEFLLRLAFTGQAQDKPCGHLADARVFEPATDACAQCVAAGGFWPALRMCLVCGFVGCCDTSVSKHMRQHYESTGHAIFRSIRMREGWIWCFEDAAFFERAALDRLAAGAAGRPEA
jgi:predicted ester cyclase